MSKGSRQRPVSDMDKFKANWDAIFGAKTAQKKESRIKSNGKDRRHSPTDKG
mgnify:CR=1 FL=1